MDVVPGQGIDFEALGAVLLVALALYVGSALLGFLQGYLLNDAVQRTVFRLRAEVEDKLNRLPLRYFDRQPRGELLSRVTNDIDNVSQTLQQTMSQLLTSVLTVVFVVAMMFAISPTLALVALVTIPLSMVLAGLVMQTLPAPVHRAVASHRHPQCPDRGGLHRPRPGQGVRPAGRGAGLVRGRERGAVPGQLRRPVPLRVDHADR